MTRSRRHWPWLILIVPVILGLLRLRFDVDILDLLPSSSRPVQGIRLYQEQFANARELVITVQGSAAEPVETAARVIAEALRRDTNLVASVVWQPPWLEHPGDAAELLAWLWFNQPPAQFAELADRLAPEHAAAALASAREELAGSFSPGDIARLSYDPFGLTQLPRSVAGTAPSFEEGQELFASADGTFRILFVEARPGLSTYRDCTAWLNSVKRNVDAALAGRDRAAGAIAIGYTGRPAFVSEISGGMQRDMTMSVGGTSVVIALLFWIAHRRWKPMLWLLVLLALILIATLGLGGLLIGRISVVSMGFAAILLGLAVDYAVVHYQEALTHPDLSVPEIRHAIAPAIFWAAVTTISAFLVLNFGGLPGLGQLGSLVGIGVALAACVMIFAFLPPLFPDRLAPHPHRTASAGTPRNAVAQPSNSRIGVVTVISIALVVTSSVILMRGLPALDPTANALRPRNSPSYAALDQLQEHLGRNKDPLWLVVSGTDVSTVGNELDRAQSALQRATSNGVVASFTLPAALWPRPQFQSANRSIARRLVELRPLLHAIASTNGFTDTALALTDGMLTTWDTAASAPDVFWPTNPMSTWIFNKVIARAGTNDYALGLVYPNETNGTAGIASLESELPHENTWLSGWGLLGSAVFSVVRHNMWKLLVPMLALVLLSLLLAFRRPTEVVLSVVTLILSGLCLLAVMRFTGWSWNLLNLMGIPLILGTGVDYSIFTQLALRRHNGDVHMAHRSVGRALLLCGGTAVAGFSSLAWSSNAGMSSLGQVCAVGIGWNMAISVFLLPVWWHRFAARDRCFESKPSSLYRAHFWKFGLWIARRLPRRACAMLSRAAAGGYWHAARRRREVVIENLLPPLGDDRAAATRAARSLFRQFALKLTDLWRYESGLPVDDQFGPATGWEYFAKAQSENRGVLLLTPHLGNWEFGAPWLTRKGVRLQVVTLAEPGEGFTELRLASRARWNIETLVIGNDPFAFVEIIRRLEAGATVALLIDRPPPPSAVTVELFGRPFPASVAAAELARASGCVLLPVYLPRIGEVYGAHVLPPILYDRSALRDREARRLLTQRIVQAFEPILRDHLDQWFHFVPVWRGPP